MSTKISTSKILKMIRNSFWGLLVVFIIGVLILSFFIYKNIYLAITQNEEIIILQGQLALEPVDISLFRSILSKIEQKKIGLDLEEELIKNPFRPYTANNEE